MLKNMTEILAEQKLDALWKAQECCKCEKCREDVLARALNKLPPHYVSTDAGGLYERAKMLNSRYDFEIMREVAMAIQAIKDQPRHT